MAKLEKSIKPALAYRALTPLYDLVVRATLRERRFKSLLLAQAGIAPAHRVLDLGCGTGTLTLFAVAAQPEAEFLGVDADPEILARARRKLGGRQAGRVLLNLASATKLPFADGVFDRVLSTLMFHHLDPDGKRAALSDCLRVLRPGGELHVADWGRPHGTGMRLLFLAVQLLDGFATTRDSVFGTLPQSIAQAGFRQVRQHARLRTLFGTLALYSARRP